MGDPAAYALAVALGLAGATWSLVRFHRRYEVSRSRPPTLRYALGTGAAGAGCLILLTWVFGDWNGVYFAGVGTFAGVFWFGTLVWPLVRP